MNFTPEVRETIAAIKAKCHSQITKLEKLEFYAWLQDQGQSWDSVKGVQDSLSWLERYHAGHPPKGILAVCVKITFKDDTTWIGWCPFSHNVIFKSALNPEELI